MNGNGYYIIFASQISFLPSEPCGSPWNGSKLEALSAGDRIYRDLNAVIDCWRDQWQWLIHGLLVTIGVEAVALLLIDRLGGKKAHQQIKKHRANIHRCQASKKERCV